MKNNNKTNPWINHTLYMWSVRVITYKLGKYVTLRLNHSYLFAYLFLLGIWWISWNTRKARGKTSRIRSKSPKVRKGNQTWRMTASLSLLCSFWKEGDNNEVLLTGVGCDEGNMCMDMGLVGLVSRCLCLKLTLLYKTWYWDKAFLDGNYLWVWF